MGGTLVAVLASGDGTTAEALMRACLEGAVACEVGLVISSRESAGVLGRVERINRERGAAIALACVGPKSHPPEAGERLGPGDQTAAEAAAIAQLLRDGGFGLVVLMGYLRRVAPGLVHDYGWRPGYTSVHQARMLNIHPGLLPETKGLYGIRVQEHVLAGKLAQAGHVVHVVGQDYDDGPVVAEHRIPVRANDTAAVLSERVKALQRQQVPGDIGDFATARARLLGGLGSPAGGLVAS
jgi:phosphoribosylglycinamide formyltransferase-1